MYVNTISVQRYEIIILRTEAYLLLNTKLKKNIFINQVNIIFLRSSKPLSFQKIIAGNLVIGNSYYQINSSCITFHIM